MEQLSPIFSFRRRLISNGSWALAGSLLASISGFLTNVLITRLLSPESAGSYFLLISTIAIAIPLASFGMGRTMIHLVAQSLGKNQPGRAKKAIIRAGYCVLSGTVLLTFMLFVGGHAFINKNIIATGISRFFSFYVSVWVLFCILNNYFIEALRGLQKIQLIVFMQAICNFGVVFILSISFFLELHIKLEHVVQFSVIITGITTLIISYLLLRILASLDDIGDISTIEIIRVAWPFWISSISMYIYTKANIWIVSAYISKDAVALYATAIKLSAIVVVSHTILISFILPVIAEKYSQQENDKLERVLSIGATIAIIPSITITIIYLICGDSILAILFGDFYSEAKSTLLILSISLTICMLAGPVEATLMMTGHHKEYMFIILLFGLFNLLLSFLLIPFGIEGIALASGCTYLLQTLFTMVVCKIKTNLTTAIRFHYIILFFHYINIKNIYLRFIKQHFEY